MSDETNPERRSVVLETSESTEHRHRWSLEWTTPWEYIAVAIQGELYKDKSPYQEIEILDVEGYGPCLLLDGEVQSYAIDEHMYHEALVHPALVLSEPVRSVLIIGGGEGATIREVLRHRSVERVAMVDLDEWVVNACKEHLPSFHAGAFDDPRVDLSFGCGRGYLESRDERFDAIIIDINNPLEGGPAARLFTVEFYELVRSRLKPGGVVSLQAGSGTTHGMRGLATISRTLNEVFGRSYPGTLFIPSFLSDWAFLVTGDGLVDPTAISGNELEGRIRERLVDELRSYDGESHLRMFNLPRYIRDGLGEGAISTDGCMYEEHLPGFATASFKTQSD